MSRSVLVDSVNMQRIIASLNKAESWPQGVLVRRYFKPKRNGSPSTV